MSSLCREACCVHVPSHSRCAYTPMLGTLFARRPAACPPPYPEGFFCHNATLLVTPTLSTNMNDHRDRDCVCGAPVWSLGRRKRLHLIFRRMRRLYYSGRPWEARKTALILPTRPAEVGATTGDAVGSSICYSSRPGSRALQKAAARNVQHLHKLRLFSPLLVCVTPPTPTACIGNSVLNREKGLYACAVGGLPLFTSGWKLEARTDDVCPR